MEAYATTSTSAKVKINREDCTGCGICLGSCKQQALTISSTLNHFGVYPVQQQSGVCDGCGVCYYLCPEPGAIALIH